MSDSSGHISTDQILREFFCAGVKYNQPNNSLCLCNPDFDRNLVSQTHNARGNISSLSEESSECSLSWNFTQLLSALEYHEYDDDVWTRFPESVVVPVLFGSILVIGLVGNGLVVYVVVRSGAVKSVTNLYFLNLAIADIFFLIFCAPFTASLYLPLAQWPFGAFMCKVVNYLMLVSTAASVMTLMAMGFDRYQAVVRPVQSRVHRTVKKTLTLLVIIWSLNLLSCIPALFLSQLKQFWDFGDMREYCFNYFSRPVYKKAYTLTLFIMFYCLPLLFIAACYFLMSKNLRAHVKPGTRQQASGGAASGRPSTTTMTVVAPSNNNNSRARRHRSRRRLSKLVLLVVTTFAVCWLPIHCFHLMTDFSNLVPKMSVSESFIFYIVKIVAHCLSYANSAINPCLYAFMSENFRKCFKDAFRCLQEERESQEGQEGVIRIAGVQNNSGSSGTPGTGSGGSVQNQKNPPSPADTSVKSNSLELKITTVTRLTTEISAATSSSV